MNMKNSTTGNLTVKVVTANLKKDKDWILKQDPYAIVYFGNQTFKTKTHMMGGKHPHWSDVFSMKKTNEDILRVRIYDHDFFSRDDYLGEGAIPVQKLLDSGRYTNWIDLVSKGKKTGKVLIETEFKPDNIMQQPLQQNQCTFSASTVNQQIQQLQGYPGQQGQQGYQGYQQQGQQCHQQQQGFGQQLQHGHIGQQGFKGQEICGQQLQKQNVTFIPLNDNKQQQYQQNQFSPQIPQQMTAQFGKGVHVEEHRQQNLYPNLYNQDTKLEQIYQKYHQQPEKDEQFMQQFQGMPQLNNNGYIQNHPDLPPQTAYNQQFGPSAPFISQDNNLQAMNGQQQYAKQQPFFAGKPHDQGVTKPQHPQGTPNFFFN